MLSIEDISVSWKKSSVLDDEMKKKSQNGLYDIEGVRVPHLSSEDEDF